ncbi:hypothetical protein, partial [Erwinia psidii]
FEKKLLRRFSVLNLLTRRPVSRCSVSVVAHYREFVTTDKCYLKKKAERSIFELKVGKSRYFAKIISVTHQFQLTESQRNA